MTPFPFAGADCVPQHVAGGSSSMSQKPAAKPIAKRKKAAKDLQEKRRRLQAAARPSEEEVLAAFELFNRQHMPALIASDIEKVMRTRCACWCLAPVPDKRFASPNDLI